MELIIPFRTQYFKFARENKSAGYCAGFCLTWLGDVLKDRPVQVQKNFLQSGFPIGVSPLSQMHAPIPVDEQEFRKFLERVKRRHVNFESRFVEALANNRHLPSSNNQPLAFNADFKNDRQRESEIKTGVPGLVYSYNNLGSMSEIKGLSYLGKPVGTILGVIIPGPTYGMHAVAVLSMSPEEMYYLDPNYGLFKIDHNDPRTDIIMTLNRTYIGAKVEMQVIISRK